MTWHFTPSRNKINRNYIFIWKTFLEFPYHPYFHICYLLTSQLYQIANPFYTYFERLNYLVLFRFTYLRKCRHTSVLAIRCMFYKKIWKMLGFNQFTWSMIATSNHKREPVKTTSSLWSRQKTFNNLLTCSHWCYNFWFLVLL